MPTPVTIMCKGNRKIEAATVGGRTQLEIVMGVSVCVIISFSRNIFGRPDVTL
jgi:hypothetical protein